jgi:Tetratricopeptide repeat
MKSGVKLITRAGIVFALLMAVAVGVSYILTDSKASRAGNRRSSAPLDRSGALQASRRAQKTGRKPWNMRDDGTPYLYGEGWFDDSGYFFGVMFTNEPSDPGSLEEISSNVGMRASRGVSYMKQVLAGVPQDDADSALQITQLHLAIGGLYMYDGKFDDAKREFEAARDAEPNSSDLLRANYETLLGVTALRHGEVENCVACRNEESCIFPLAAGAFHQKTSGSREAMARFTTYLRKRPEDIGVRWLLNIAAMTLGEYPAGVPDSAGALPIQDRRGPVRQRRASRWP